MKLSRPVFYYSPGKDFPRSVCTVSEPFAHSSFFGAAFFSGALFVTSPSPVLSEKSTFEVTAFTASVGIIIFEAFPSPILTSASYFFSSIDRGVGICFADQTDSFGFRLLCEKDRLCFTFGACDPRVALTFRSKDHCPLVAFGSGYCSIFVPLCLKKGLTSVSAPPSSAFPSRSVSRQAELCF